MTVIINDFEIMVEPPSVSTQPAEEKQTQPQPAAMTMRPEDIERIVCHFEARRARVAAD